MTQPEENYYDILSVRPDASLQDITTSYRKLAKILHPDVCESPDADELFKVVNEAYQVLKDPKKREEYDATLVLAESSQYSRYYQGTHRYRDPRTWYYTNQHQKRTTQAVHEEPVQQPKSSFPRIVQVLLFYLTLFMAVIIIAELFLLPWISGTNSTDARNSLAEGNRWMSQEEYQKAIESYQDATVKLPSFAEAWRAKGFAEMKKGDALSRLGLPDAEQYYRDAIRSFSKISPQNPEDLAVTKAMAEAYLNVHDRRSALSLLNSAEKSGHWDTEMSDLLRDINSPSGQATSTPVSS
ncbi:MAG: DnaJ domain-containing protein [Methanospirillum sp.]|uniref:J domain-containing protein n=1 Tax=Methanospirillum sp. TaxID=45200 RepID=UPI002372CB1F|nr:DnaJ domain-containing protein [Methanospirillum sp.]MDD1728164.1 DnaJ domain-containing protein [Methanospirillum sp.]